jgi:hypothetical protein
MTIGIVAFGPNAGQAVFDALRAAERVGRGSIGGYASYVAMEADGALHWADTQRGGTSTLFIDGEATGIAPPAKIAKAKLAAAMSSGPDRPEPLSQFTPAEAGIGVVTGHRLPNMPGTGDIPVNVAVLELMKAGSSPREAVDQVLDASPEADAGIVAGDLRGRVFARNSARVARRPDPGHARREGGGAVVEIIHNAILPASSLAHLVADIAMETMLGLSLPQKWIIVRAGTPIELGEQDSVIVDGGLVATKIVTTDSRIFAGVWNCAAVYLGSRVIRGHDVLGATIVEPNMVVEDGRLASMSGQSEIRIGFRRNGDIGGAGNEGPA